MKILIVDDVMGWRTFHENTMSELFPDAGIDTAECARDGYDMVYNNLSSPYDIIITDLQMEEDFLPEYAGEWLVEQVKLLSQYNKTKIVIVSATGSIRTIAEDLQVDYIPKRIAVQTSDAYKEVLSIQNL